MSAGVLKINRIFLGFLVISVLIHAVVFIRVSSLYNAGHQLRIELTMRDISKPFMRHIPRPKNRKVKVPDTAEQVITREKTIVSVPPVTPDMMKIIPSDMVAAQKIPNTAMVVTEPIAQNLTRWEPQRAAVSEFSSQNHYFQMVQQKIEAHKHYPEQARRKNQQGRVTLRFSIRPDGHISILELSQKSSFGSLNQAALNAVRKASPFPRPPASLFKGTVNLKLTLAFEMI